MAKTSISISDDVMQELDDRRHSTTDRSEWIEEAIRMRFVVEDASSWGGNPFGDDDEDETVAAQA